MNPEMEKELETEIDRALQSLPALAAPPGFVTRTLSALDRPAPRRIQPWAKWPVSARIAFLIVALSAMAAGLEGLRLIEPGLLAGVWRRLAPVVAGVASFWGVVSALAGAAGLAAQQMGKGFMLACLVAVAGACAVCAGFGTIFVRLALARPGKSLL